MANIIVFIYIHKPVTVILLTGIIVLCQTKRNDTLRNGILLIVAYLHASDGILARLKIVVSLLKTRNSKNTISG